MKKILVVIILILVLLTSCQEKTASNKERQTSQSATTTPLTASTDLNRPTNPQIGLNFIRFYFSLDEGGKGTLDTTTPITQPDTIFEDFSTLHINVFRQFVKGDLLWDNVEPKEGSWDFTAPDTVMITPDFQPVVTLFSMQYASPTPPWEKDATKFQKTLGPEAKEYLDTILDRYVAYVTYWEIGNEMDHWRFCDETEATRASIATKNPSVETSKVVCPEGGFSPQEQGEFFAEVAAYIREKDADAIIVMPGMSGLDDYQVKTWFAGVLEGGGTDWFDVVNYHYYGDWKKYGIQREALTAFLEANNIANKPVWLTETGSTSDATLTQRTNYPNSEESQAADVFRRIIQAYGYGDSLVMWHTYIGSEDDMATNDWRAYGLMSGTGKKKPSYYAFKLLTEELTPFSSVTTIHADFKGVNSYKIVTEAGATKYVAWGSGTFTIPSGITQMTSVIPNSDGMYTWESISAEESITLSENPILLK